ncbi:MAG: hypothetical protein JXA87_06680 [Thermoleophilia bacterium]|nr:hypothetical protein [Thermoleophilia bacterium]
MMRSDRTRSRRDTHLGVASAIMAAGYLLGLAADITYLALDRIIFLGSILFAGGWLFEVGGPVLRGIGFAFIAAAFLGTIEARRARFRCGGLLLAGGYGLMVAYVVLVTLSPYRSPDLYPLEGFLSGMIMQVVAYLSALVAALLVASVFRKPADVSTTEDAARNRRLGWASVGFGLELTLLLLSGLVSVPFVVDGGTVDLAGMPATAIVAIAAAAIAAAGFFGAARGYRFRVSDPVPRREGVLAVAATLYLVYRGLDLVDLRDVASWLWRLELAAFAVAAFCAATGFIISRRSFLISQNPLFSGDND